LDHSGNIRFKSLIEDKLDEYAKATSKTEKSRLVTMIFDDVMRNGSFVRKDNDGHWYTVKDTLAREKISQGFRDYLNGKYQSSKAAKQKRRKEIRKEAGSSYEGPCKRLKVGFEQQNPSLQLRRTSDAFRQLMLFSNSIERETSSPFSDGRQQDQPQQEMLQARLEESRSNGISTGGRRHSRSSFSLRVPSIICCNEHAGVSDETSLLLLDSYQ
jgi:hypothetical protein